MHACADDPQSLQRQARAFRWSLLAVAVTLAAVLAIRLLTPSSAVGAGAVERITSLDLVTGAPIAAGLLLAVYGLWRS